MSVKLEHVRLADLADVNPPTDGGRRSGSTPVSFIPMQAVDENGDWTDRQTRVLREVKAGYTAFQEGDVLFAKITPCMENGKGAHAIGLEHGLGFGSTEFHVLRARAGHHSRFIYHWTRSQELRQRARAFMIGSAGQQRVQPDFFANFTVPFLAPLEQRRIADILDTLDDAIRRTEQVIAKLLQVKQGLLHDLLTRGVDQNGELRESPAVKPHLYAKSVLGFVPRPWQIWRLGEVASWSSGGTPSKASARFWGGAIPWVSPKDMKQFRLVRTQDHLTPLGLAAGSRVAPEGAVLIVVRGMILAHTFPVCLTTRPMAFNQDVKAVAAGPAADGEFLAYWFLGKAGAMLGLVTEATHGTKRIDLSALLEFPVALPPRPEARQLAQMLAQHDGSIGACQAELDKMVLLRQGLSRDLLTGRVRVPLD